jgi:hypothetical protein
MGGRAEISKECKDDRISGKIKTAYSSDMGTPEKGKSTAPQLVSALGSR